MTPCTACDAIAAAMMARPELRALTAPELAAAMDATPENASQGIAAAFRELTGHEPPRLPGSDLSFDDLLVLLGRPSFVRGPHNGAPMSTSRVVFLPAPSVVEHAILLRPDLASAPWVRYWRESNGVAIAKSHPCHHVGAGWDLFGAKELPSGGSEPGDTGTPTPEPDPAPGADPWIFAGGAPTVAPDGTVTAAPGGGSVAKNPSRPLGTPGLYQSDPSKQWIFSILSGWSPRLYAAQITGNENRARELIDLNAAEYGSVGSPGSIAYNLVHFRTGDPIQIPKAWNAYISQDGDWGTKGAAWPAAPAVIAPPPTIKGTTGGTYTAGLPDGTIAGIKTQLGALGKKYPAMDLGGYPGLWDLNDAVDEAFRAAVSRFQAWANAQTAGPPATVVLRTDGTLDEATHARINAWTTYAVDDGVKVVPTDPGSVTTIPGFTPSWPTGVPGTGPAGPGKDLIPDVPGAKPAGPAVPGMLGSNQVASSGSSDGGGGAILGALALAYLTLKGM